MSNITKVPAGNERPKFSGTDCCKPTTEVTHSGVTGMDQSIRTYENPILPDSHTGNCVPTVKLTPVQKPHNA